jgi:MYXO-CTERM domain-containing protein
VCQPVGSISCEDYNPCTQDWCDPQQGCLHERLPDGYECGECYMCVGGECMRATDCGKAGGCSSAGAPGGMPGLAGILLLILFFWRRR